MRDRPGIMNAIAPITDTEFRLFRDLILQEAGISLSDAKRTLVETRLSRRLRYLGFRTYSQYHRYLMTQDPEREERLRMINCLTTNKTAFFREPHHFTFLRTEVLPAKQTKRQAGVPRRLRIWSAGSSSGEEAYSIAMTIREFTTTPHEWDVKILASDIDTDMLNHGAEGIYSTGHLADVSPLFQRKYFLPRDHDPRGLVQVCRELRDLVVFRRINLIEEAWPIRTRFDVIFCRNVIIYFNRETQSKLFNRFADFLEDDGYLIVGHSETLLGLTDKFIPLQNTVYRRR